MPQDFTHANAQPFLLEAGDTAILLIHGFTGSPSHMRTIGEAACAAGFTARGILLPGHGKTIKDMIQSGDKQWLDACVEAYREMEGRYRRVAVGGLSMGGILSIILAERFAPAALILFAPAMRYKTRVNYLSPIAKHFLRVSPWRPRPFAPEDFLTDYDYGYQGAPVAKVEDMTRLQRAARKDLSKVGCPTLIFQSHQDESVHCAVPERILRRTSSQVKEIAWVDRSPHVLTLGPDRAYVNDRVVDFLRRYGV